jgi:hypothetical protein
VQVSSACYKKDDFRQTAAGKQIIFFLKISQSKLLIQSMIPLLVDSRFSFKTIPIS